MPEPSNALRTAAVYDFRQARRQAAIQEILARLTGHSIDLMSFEDIREKLKIRGGTFRGLHEIPLDAIVGSVGRYKDFTRTFLPRQDRNVERWAGVRAATLDLSGLPPIEVYQIGEVYFVLDGNHRVSVARSLGARQIQAYVVEFETKVPLSPDDQPDDIIIKAEYANFLERTRLDELRPGADIRVTAPGRYRELETDIEAHRFLLGQQQDREIPWAEAVCHWYDNVYLPVISAIRRHGILHEFPGRTETDLYLWLIRHRAALEKRLGWHIDPSKAATDLAATYSPKAQRVVSRVEGKLVDTLLPAPLDTGPAPGQWRRNRLAARPDDRLFTDIMVTVSQEAHSWQAFEQAQIIARREGGQLLGLYVVASDDQVESDPTQAIRAEFEQRCQIAGIPGTLSVEVGQIARKIIERARWVDLVVMRLAHPPGVQPLDRLSSGFWAVLHRCPRPVLAVPGPVSNLEPVLLAYDGSPKAQEGLYVAAYLAGQWSIPLVVSTVLENERDQQYLNQAQTYLEAQGVTATLVSKQGPVAETIMTTANEHGCQLIILGGFGTGPVWDVVLGSVVDQVLCESKQPMLICR